MSEERRGYSAKTPLPEDAVPPTQSGVPHPNGQNAASEPHWRDFDGVVGNGAKPPSDGLRARVTQLQPEIGVQILNADGDNVRLISYKTPEPIPRADPQGRGRSIGQRVDEMIAEAEQRAVRDYQRAIEEAAQAAR